MSPKIKDKSVEVPMSQYNVSFNMHYDVILQQLAEKFFQDEIIESDSKYGIAHYSILRMLFDYVDEVVKGFQYSPEHLVLLIEEHDKLKTKFEAKLLALAGEKQDKIDSMVLEIESE